MSNTLQDLEEYILRDQHIIQDLDTLFEGILEHDLDTDNIANMVLGIIEMYKVRHDITWRCYENLVKEYYKFRNEAGYNKEGYVDTDVDGPDLWNKSFVDWKPGHPDYDAALAKMQEKYGDKPDAWVADVGEKPTEEEKAEWPAKQKSKKNAKPKTK